MYIIAAEGNSTLLHGLQKTFDSLLFFMANFAEFLAEEAVRPLTPHLLVQKMFGGHSELLTHRIF